MCGELAYIIVSAIDIACCGNADLVIVLVVVTTFKFNMSKAFGADITSTMMIDYLLKK